MLINDILLHLSPLLMCGAGILSFEVRAGEVFLPVENSALGGGVGGMVSVENYKQEMGNSDFPV